VLAGITVAHGARLFDCDQDNVTEKHRTNAAQQKDFIWIKLARVRMLAMSLSAFGVLTLRRWSAALQLLGAKLRMNLARRALHAARHQIRY
jgi:hypothetical protein